MRIFFCVCAVLAACAAWTPVVVKKVTELGPQITPDVTQVSRDGGYSVLLDGRIVWLYDDTECFDLGKKQLSFVSNTAAYAKDPNKNVSILQDFGVEAVGKEKKSGITDYAILADKTVGTGGWIAFSDDELYFNKERKGRERVAIWPGTSPTPYSTSQAFMFSPLVYVDSKPKNPSKRYQARGMTLISISASSKGPIATRHGDLIISGNEIAFGGFTSLLGYTSTANPQDLDKRDVYLLGITDGGLQLARARQEVLTDFSKYRFWDPVELKFINRPPKVDEKDYKKIYLPGSFTYGSIFYSPYFNTFIMVYFNKFVDSTFRIRFLDLNNPVGQDPVWPKQGKHGSGIAAEDIEALVKYGWSPEQELYKSPPGKGGFNYAGMAHPEYFNRQYFAPSLYPSSTSADRRRNQWYGSATVSEEDAGGDAKHLLISWTSQLKGGFDSGVYQVRLAKVEFDAVPENPGGNFPSAAASSRILDKIRPTGPSTRKNGEGVVVFCKQFLFDDLPMYEAQREARTSMCVIERFHLIHPDGFRERKERLRYCPYGSPVTPCNDTRIVNAMDELLDPAVDAAPAPHHQIIEPRPVDRQRPEDRKKPKKIVDDIKLVFDFHIPFTSHKKEKKAKKPHKDPRPERVMGQPRGPEHFALPPELRHQPPQMGFPEPGRHPIPPPPPMHGPPIGRPGGQVTPPITVYSYGSTDSSPSPLSPTREHQRPRARSLSITRQYEERKRIIREQEGRERAERIAKAENAARLTAEREAERTREEAERIREERDRERHRNEDLQAREQRRQIEAVESERRRSQEERKRLAQAIVARQRREDSNRRRAAEAVLERERQQLARRRRDDEKKEPVWSGNKGPESRGLLVTQRQFIITTITTMSVIVSSRKPGRTLRNAATESSTTQSERSKREWPSETGTPHSQDGRPKAARDVAVQLVQVKDKCLTTIEGGGVTLEGADNSLYIRPYDFDLPPEQFESSINGARIYIAQKIASADGKANVPLPADQDPFVYGPNLAVEISWQSLQGKRLTWGILAGVMRGLSDCLVKNNRLPFVAVWHVFDEGQGGEVGYGRIGKGRGVWRGRGRGRGEGMAVS
ncbi:MAG: hypothetical protein Q9210_000258 [Variospora velana]